MLIKSWNWKKATAISLSSFVLLVSGVGLTSCGEFGGEVEEQKEEGNPLGGEEEEDDD